MTRIAKVVKKKSLRRQKKRSLQDAVDNYERATMKKVERKKTTVRKRGAR